MIEVRALRHDDERSGFRSGQADLDRFFQRYAGQNQFKHHIGVTYVAVGNEADDRVLGFTTVSASQIETSDLGPRERRRLPRYPLPVLRLARLAVDQGAQGRGVGLCLLKYVLTLARRMSTEVGCVGVVVDAKEEAVGFYGRFGFEALGDVTEGELGDRPRPTPMFLPVKLIPEMGME